MPPLVPALIAGAGAIGGAVIASNATSRASKAASDAAAQNAAIQQQQYEQTRADLAPYNQAGYSGLTALQQRLGLAPAVNSNAAPAASRPGPQIAAYSGPGAQPAAPAAAPGGGGMFGVRIAPPANPFAGPTYTDRATPVDSLPPMGKGTEPQLLPGLIANVAPTNQASPQLLPGLIANGAPTTQVNPYLSATPTAAAQPTTANGQLTADQIAQIEKDRPDVLQAAQSNPAGGSVTDNINNWYNGGKQAAGDTYSLPSAAAPTATTPASPPPAVPGQTFTSSDNGGLGDRAAPARQTINRPDFTQQEPTYTDPTFGAAPSVSDYVNPANFTTSPGYQFRLDQGLRADNANYAARGLLKSDAAVKGLNDYSQGMASSEYGNWFNQQMQRYGADASQFNTDRSTGLAQFNTDRTTGLAQYNQNRNIFNQNYNTDTSRYDNNFNTDVGNYNANFNADRGYNTDQYNTYTGNLFNLTGIGQSAAGNTANAGQNYAAAATANNNSLASVRGNAAIAGANGITGAINGAAQTYGAFANPFSVSGAGSAPAASYPADGSSLNIRY